MTSNLAAAALLLGSCAAFLTTPTTTTTRTRPRPLRADYLSQLSSSPPTTPSTRQTTAPPAPSGPATTKKFAHATFGSFAVKNLRPKGPRSNADVGSPHDATLPLTEVGSASAGSWWCAEGGWPSPAQRTTTEVFFVFAGHGCLTDLDGQRHYFGPGDTVILPKGWSGRWDVLESIHKVWFVLDHPRVEETATPIRAQVVYHAMLTPHDRGATTGCSTASRTLYHVGPTQVGSWTCTPGSFPVDDLQKTEWLHVLEGVFTLTSADGSQAQTCVPGDTVVLPRGWTGRWDVHEPVKKLWVISD